jgi:hypothetical protein
MGSATIIVTVQRRLKNVHDIVNSLDRTIREAILKTMAEVAEKTMKNAGNIDKKAQALKEAVEAHGKKVFAKALSKVLQIDEDDVDHEQV